MNDWKGMLKAVEEVSELIKELGEFIQQAMKLNSYPDGNHPRRKKNLIAAMEEEAADVLATVDYLIDRNGLNRSKILRRRAYKYRKFEKRWGDVPKAVKERAKPVKKQSRPSKKQPKKQAKKRATK